MLKLFLGLLGGVVFFFPIAGAGADQAQEIADITEKASPGLSDLFNLDYEEALATFKNLQENHPNHPAPPLYEAIVVWQRELFRRRDLKLERFVSPGYFTESTESRMPDGERKLFLRNLEKSMSLSEKILSQSPDHLVAKYFLGSAKGVLAAFKITIDHDKMAAFDHGKKAYNLHKEVIDKDPEFYDAYSTVGVYQYIADNLPWYIKWIAVIAGFSGDEEKGLEYLRLSAEKSQYANDDAQVILMVLLVREEEYAKALEVANDLHRKYSKNFLLHLNRAQIFEKMDRQVDAFREYQKVLQSAEAGRPNYDRVNLSPLRFKLAEEAFDLGKLEIARDHFRQLSELEKGKAHRMARSLIRLGQIHDLQDSRDRALESYRQVLERERLSEWHDQAEKYLERPYRRP